MLSNQTTFFFLSRGTCKHHMLKLIQINPIYYISYRYDFLISQWIYFICCGLERSCKFRNCWVLSGRILLFFQYGCVHGLKSGDVIALLLGQICKCVVWNCILSNLDGIHSPQLAVSYLGFFLAYNGCVK